MTSPEPADPPIDAVTRRVLGLETYLDQVQPRGDQARGRWNRLTTRPFPASTDRPDEIERLKRIEDRLCADSTEVLGQQLASLPTLERTLRRLGAGETLRDADFFEIKRFLYHATTLLEEAGGLDGLPTADSDVADRLREAMSTIHPDHGHSKRFHLADELDAQLAEQRDRLRQIRRRLRDARRRLESDVVDDYGGRFDLHGRYHPDTTPELSEDDRLRHQGGHIRLADPKLVELQHQRDELEQRVRQLEHDQRRRLTDFVADLEADIVGLKDRLVELDLRLTRIELRDRLDGCWPTFDPTDDCWLRLEAGRDPALVEASSADEIQPVDVRLSTDGTVVLGPNMGGKSSLLRLAGLAAWCSQMALPVPADACRVGELERIVYVGSEEPDDTGPTEGLSSFGREIRRFDQFWDTGARTLWLLDEPCRGTHPDEGTRLAAAIARDRIERGDRVVVATHFPGLAQRCGFSRLRIAGIEADRERLEEALTEAENDNRPLHQALRQFMDYRVVDDHQGRVPRDGWRIARALGLDLPPPDED